MTVCFAVRVLSSAELARLLSCDPGRVEHPYQSRRARTHSIVPL
jgi:hypothetical protein